MPISIVAVVACIALVCAAIGLPAATGWDVHTRADAHAAVPPWHGWWNPHVGPGTVPVVILAVAALVHGPTLAQRLPWRRLVGATYVSSLGWLAGLALVDGTSGLSRVLGNPHEYMRTARHVHAVGPLLATFVDHIPLHAPQHWPTHVAGHPPGILLFFVALVRLGLGGNLTAGIVVTVIAATIAPAVVVTLRLAGAEAVARRSAPFLVFTPAAVYLAVSADAVMAAVAAWGVALVAYAAGDRGARRWVAALAAGSLFGVVVLMSYGLVLFAIVPLGLIVALSASRLIVPCGLAALAVVLLPGAWGFWWPEAFGVLRSRYWDGVASERPASYWTWANLAVLASTAGPAVAAGLTRVRTLSKPAVGLALGAATAVLVADLSQMSRAEVERIWLPFVPWLTVAVAALPDTWRRPALASQVVIALALQHLMYTTW